MENYIIANMSDVGQARQVNEDSMVTFDSPNGRVVAVCDGMGGQAAGDLASQLACEIISDILTNNSFATPAEAITRAMMAANQGILHRASQSPELEGMGATCVMLIIKDGMVYYGWVGDSRIYLISNHTIHQLSKDQSYVQMLVDTGQLSQEEAEHHPRKNEILNALGVPNMTPPVVCQAPITPAPGSVFLLCSDGLSGMVDNAHIERIVSRNEISLQERANALVNLANQNGGLDNITVQLVQFEGGAAAAAPNSRQSRKGGGYAGIIYSCLVAFAVILIGFLVWTFFFKEEEKPAPKATGTEIIDTRSDKADNAQEGSSEEKAAPAKENTSQKSNNSKGSSVTQNPSTNNPKGTQDKAKDIQKGTTDPKGSDSNVVKKKKEEKENPKKPNPVPNLPKPSTDPTPNPNPNPTPIPNNTKNPDEI